MTASLSLTPAVAGSNQPTSTRAAFHGPTHGSAIGASQPLDHSSGTVCRPGFASPTTKSQNFFGSWSCFCLIDTAAHSDYCSYAPVKYSYSLTHYSLAVLRELKIASSLSIFLFRPTRVLMRSVLMVQCSYEQESCAIAKMTARCALYE